MTQQDIITLRRIDVLVKDMWSLQAQLEMEYMRSCFLKSDVKSSIDRIYSQLIIKKGVYEILMSTLHGKQLQIQ